MTEITEEDQQAGRTAPVGWHTRGRMSELWLGVLAVAGGSFEGQDRGLLRQPAQGAQVDQGIADGHLLAVSTQAQIGQSLQGHRFSGTVAALGEVAPATPFPPGARSIGRLASQAGPTIGEHLAKVNHLAMLVLGAR